MHTQPVKGAVARRVLPTIPHELDYPATRQAAVTIPSRMARDPQMANMHIKLALEIAAAGGDSQWVMLPTVTFLQSVLHIHHSAIGRALLALEAAHYIEVKRISRQLRYVRIVTPGYALDWE